MKTSGEINLSESGSVEETSSDPSPQLSMPGREKVATADVYVEGDPENDPPPSGGGAMLPVPEDEDGSLEHLLGKLRDKQSANRHRKLARELADEGGLLAAAIYAVVERELKAQERADQCSPLNGVTND